MAGSIYGPWFIVAALVLLAVAVRRAPRSSLGELSIVGVITLGAAIARLVWGIWGPLHVNGQGPLWVRGALDPAALAGYGPGYYELFGWMAPAGIARPADTALFAANALLSALSPALLYAAARLAGVERGGALAVSLVLAIDAVSVRTAASEGYHTPIIALTLGVYAAVALAVRAGERRDRLAEGLALGAAGLLAAAAARIHPVAYVPIALAPLVALGAEQSDGLRTRLGRAVMAGAAVAAVVLLSSGVSILATLSGAEMTGHAFAGFAPGELEMLGALLVAALLLQRWLKPPWLPLLGIVALMFMLLTQEGFQQHPLWKLSYQRLFWPAILLGAAPLLPGRLQGIGWALAAAAIAIFAALVPALPHLAKPTTEQLEYRFLQEALRAAPADCGLAAIGRAGKRVWEIPSYLVPASGQRGPGNQRTLENPSDLAAGGDCLLYVHSSLCSSEEGRGLCEAVEREARLDKIASRTFPAAPSYADLPYDRPEVEVIVYRVAEGEGEKRAPAASVGDGAPITPEFAKSLFDKVAALHESDGCRLAHFDTTRFRISIGLLAPSGAERALELATAPARGGSVRQAGDWAFAVPAELERECGATVAAIERVLTGTTSPRPSRLAGDPFAFLRSSYALLAIEFVLLVLGTLRVLVREIRAQRPSPWAVLAVVALWGVALVLRLTVSPLTFLHEYYHIGETVSGYLNGEISLAYGKTGPALFRFVGTLFGRLQDVQIIFLTNAVLSSLAIPAIALLDLALLRSWPRAVCAAVLLCVLPQHLRFSAAEDLYVQSVTFGLWALALFALYLRSRRLEDAVFSALALSLAMQTRPEMLFFPAVVVGLALLAESGSWRVLFAWRTIIALALLAALLVPRLLDLQQALQSGPSPAAMVPELSRYLDRLNLLKPEVTPPIYWVLLAVGLLWGFVRRPGLTVWALLLFFGFTLFSLSIFDNPPYNLRSQLLPVGGLILIAAGTASVWIGLWRQRARQGMIVGACGLAVLGAAVVASWRGFVTELRDQQLEWAFLERTVPRLPEHGVLFSMVEVGGHNLDAFPDFLLFRARKKYDKVDLRRAIKGEVPWPAAGDEVIYYQGMFCYFAFDDEPSPEPMTAPCKEVHERYVTEPLYVEELNTQGYSWLRYAAPPYRIGFFRLRALR